MNARIDPYVAYRLQLLQDAQALRSFWEQLLDGETGAKDRLAKFLHKLHGTSGTYGHDQVSELARALRERVLERPAHALDGAEVEPLAAALLQASLGQETSEAARS